MKTRRSPLSGVLLLAAASVSAFEPISGYDYLGPETRAMQDDAFENPGMVAVERGAALYRSRFGQLDISCYHCHVQHQGQRLRGQVLNQGQANGFPEYRLGKGRITSLHQRFRECSVSFRAEPFDTGSTEFKLLELYVMSRGNGLKIETPAVRF